MSRVGIIGAGSWGTASVSYTHLPTELYEVVAEILVFVNDLDKLKAKIDQR